MPRRHYNLDFVLDLSRAGYTAQQIVEKLNLDVTNRAIQKAVNKYLGPRPSRPPRRDSLRDRVIAYMVNVNDLKADYCFVCGRLRQGSPYIRALKHDDSLDSLAFVQRCCKRAGDL